MQKKEMPPKKRSFVQISPKEVAFIDRRLRAGDAVSEVHKAIARQRAKGGLDPPTISPIYKFRKACVVPLPLKLFAIGHLSRFWERDLK